MLEKYALLFLRVSLGLLFMAHGAQKLFGWFGGLGLAGTAHWLATMGFKIPLFWTILGGGVELIGGLLLVLGLLNPLGAIAVMSSMLVAITKLTWSGGFWDANGGIEFPLVLFIVLGVLALLNSDPYSLDHYFRIKLPHLQVFVIGLLIIILGTGIAIITSA